MSMVGPTGDPVAQAGDPEEPYDRPAEVRGSVTMASFRTNKDQRVALLGEVALFAGCTKDELRQIDSLMTMVDVPRGTVLTEQDAPGFECFVIVEGSASAWRNGRRLNHLEAGSFFGELALLDRKNRTATVIAETPMRLLALSRSQFQTLNTSIPAVAYRIMAEMGSRLRNTNYLVEDSDGTHHPGTPEAADPAERPEPRRFVSTALFPVEPPPGRDGVTQIGA